MSCALNATVMVSELAQHKLKHYSRLLADRLSPELALAYQELVKGLQLWCVQLIQRKINKLKCQNLSNTLH